MAATVRAVVRDVLATEAPDELALLDSVEGLSDARITELMRRRSTGTDQVGFGVTEAVALVTPVVWLAVTGVAAGVLDRSVDAAADGITARLRAVAGRLRRRKRPAEPEPDGAFTVPPLSASQLEAVCRTVRARAVAAGMAKARAEALADAVVSRLARERGD